MKLFYSYEILSWKSKRKILISMKISAYIKHNNNTWIHLFVEINLQSFIFSFLK